MPPTNSPYRFPRCQLLPLAGDQVAFQVDGKEYTRWHFGSSAPRPFFFPLLGPTGHSLTRMGHPGAANHDHHRSVWFAHQKVLGIDFWSDRTEARIRQKHWLAYQDGDDEAAMAVTLGWYDGHDPRELVEQQLVAVVRPAKNSATGESSAGTRGDWSLLLQSTFMPQSDSLEFGKTNFGFLAVRVAKSISAYFGGGEITNSDGSRGEAAIFGRPASWMDYSGPVQAAKADSSGPPPVAGITYFDHPENPGYPSRWHVREDGWMGASACRESSRVTEQDRPLVLRYLLHIHAGELDPNRAAVIAAKFASERAYRVTKAQVKHQQHTIERVD